MKLETKTYETKKEKRTDFWIGFGGGAGFIPWNERIWTTLESRRPTAALLLGDNIEQVRVEAAFALGRLGDRRGLEPLGRLTTHRGLGFKVCELLGRLGNRDAIPALVRAWKGLFVHSLTRVRAAASLVRLGETEPRRYLLRMCRSWRGDARGLALEMLGEVGGAWALPPLLEALRGRGGDAAARALGHLGNREAVVSLQEALARAERQGDEEFLEDLRGAIARLERLP